MPMIALEQIATHEEQPRARADAYQPERGFEDARGFLARLYREIGCYAVAQELGLTMDDIWHPLPAVGQQAGDIQPAVTQAA